jgi:fructose-bisphosphate aldolase, class I
MSMQPRLARLLAADGRCFDVAVDHGIFNTPDFLGGIENMGRAIDTIRAAGPDAIQLTPGQASLLQDAPGRDKPALVLRVDVANVYGPNPPPELFCELMADPVETALRLDAACVVIFLLWIPGQTELHRRCVANLCRIRPECERFGMPLMVEPIAMRPDARGFGVDGDEATIATLVRQAVELGADVIKADPTEPLEGLSRIIEVAGRRPVLVRGGGRASEDEIFRRTHEVLRRGAAGIVYGRNVIQHEDPSAITRAFMALVHEDATPERAMAILRGR